MKKKQQKKPLHKKVQHRAKMLVVPHARNKYQPQLIRTGGIVVVLLLVVVMQTFYIMTSRGFVLGGRADMSTDGLLTATNKERVQNNLESLAVDDQLAVAATQKAEDMIAHDYWAHTSPQGVTPWKWIEGVGYKYSYAGENLAKNFTTANDVVTAWMNSSEHRENILNSHYKSVGFAVVEGRLQGVSTTLVVAMYGAPKTSTMLVSTAPTVLAASSTSGSLVSQFGAKLQSMAPTILGSVILLLIVASTAATAHLYRKKLPKNIQRSWLKHHGAYKAVGMTSLAIVLVALYSGGQI